MSKPQYQNKSVRKALRLLSVFGRDKQELSLTDLARELDMLPGSMYAIITPLQDAGYLMRDPQTKRYRLGMEFLGKANCVLSGLDLREQAKPELRELTKAVSANSYLGIIYGETVLYLDREEAHPSRSGLSNAAIGYRDHLHATALGKVLTAFNDEIREQLLERESLEAITIQTITDPLTLRRELDIVRQRGYAIDREESQLGDVCIAAPVYDFEGQVTAAVSIAVTKTRFDHESVNATAAIVMDTAARISARMGYPG